MHSYVVLLRGVNVGKAKRVSMADFKQVLLGLGCASAVTLLNSGNAVVVHPKIAPASLASKIAEILEARFGFTVPVIVKSRDEFCEVVLGNNLDAATPEHSRLLVAFAQSKVSLASLQSLVALVSPPELLQLEDHAAYLHCAAGIRESKAASALLGKLGKAVTTRNWATVLKLHALVAPSAA